MLANFLSKSKPINFIILFGFFFFMYTIAIYTSFFTAGFNTDKLIKSSLFFVLFLAIFFFYNFIISKNSLTYDNSFAFYFFLLFLCFLLPTLINYKALVLLLLHLLFLRKIYSLKSIKQILKKVFDAGFWLGISFLIEPLSVVFFMLIYAGVFLHQKITIHTLLSPILGFISPIIIYFAYLFWFDKIESLLQLFYFYDINSFLIYTENNTIWFVGFVLVLTLLSLFIKSPKAFSINNSFRRNWVLLIVNLMIALVFMTIISEKNGSEIAYLFFPTSIIIANGLEVIKNTIVRNVVFILILGGVLLNQFLL